jgi:hypothetical protein
MRDIPYGHLAYGMLSYGLSIIAMLILLILSLPLAFWALYLTLWSLYVYATGIRCAFLMGPDYWKATGFTKPGIWTICGIRGPVVEYESVSFYIIYGYGRVLWYIRLQWFILRSELGLMPSRESTS